MSKYSRMIRFVLPLLVSIMWAPLASAHSHQAPGEHVNEFEKHIQAYEEEIVALAATVDKIPQAYAASKGVQASVQAFYDHWESVKVHEAIEVVTVPLYPPIWTAYAAIQQAVNEKKPAADVAAKCETLKMRLYEGMGAVRFEAIQLEQGGQRPAGQAGHYDDQEMDQQASVKAIQNALSKSVEEYAEGDVKEAKKLVGDAYLHRFEYLEGDLIVHDPELVSQLEKEFNVDLPVMMNSGKPVAQIAKLVAAMNKTLDRAAELLAKGKQNKPKIF